MSQRLKRFIKSKVPFSLQRGEMFDSLVRDKKDLIDFSCQKLQIKSFADLGGVWNVDGGYTFYTMKKHNISEAFLVDTDVTEDVMRQKARYPGLKLIVGNFGHQEVARQIGNVDAVMFFDTLLHQVKPNYFRSGLMQRLHNLSQTFF